MDKICRSCSLTCASCIGNSTNCLSCLSPLILKEGKCVNFCPDGWFKHTAENSNTVCKKCDSSCKTCTEEASHCISCAESHKLVNGSCVVQCNVGEFLDDGKCKPCDPSCHECASASEKCVSCTQGYHWHESKCVVRCPDATFLHTSDRYVELLYLLIPCQPWLWFSADFCA